MAEMVSLEQPRRQPAFLKPVRRSDIQVSTLRDLIAAMGGESHITAIFSDYSVDIGNFIGSPA